LKKHENKSPLLSALYHTFLQDALQKWKFNFCYPSSQPERSVFPVWGLTGFACYDISRAKNSILAPTKQTGARSLKFGCALRFLLFGLVFIKIPKSFLSVFEVKGCSWLLRGPSLFQ
ncbi:hypothetical protein, partial [Agathobaculum butyriciproducens]|uniref:hypothetical protein n=1 Tax=Agathobaculum butyriciproducens TaxID=1628085 RepID=UPI003AB50BDB